MASKVRYDADTGQFVSEVNKATSALKASSNTLRETQKAAKESFQQQRLEAQAAGASTEQLQKIQQKYFAELLAVRNAQKQMSAELLQGNQGALASEGAKQKAITRSKELYEQELVAIRQRNAEAAKDAGHYTPTRVQRNGTLIRGGGVRAAELSASLLPGFDTVANFAFPVLGLGFLATEIAHGVEGLIKLREEGKKAAESLARDFADANGKIRTSTDELAVQADKVQADIDKLSGHPGRNGLKLALDESAVAADKLRDSLAGDRKELAELLKGRSISGFQSLLTGVSTNDKQAKEIDKDAEEVQRKVDAAYARYNAAVSKAGSLDQAKGLAGKRDDEVAAILQERADAYAGEAKRLQDEQAASRADVAQRKALESRGARVGGSDTAIDNSIKISGAQGAADRYRDRLSNFNGGRAMVRLQDQDEAAKAAKEAATQAKSAADKQMEEQRQLWDNEYTSWQAAANRTSEEIRKFWASKVVTVEYASKNYFYAQDKANEAAKKVREQGDVLWFADRAQTMATQKTLFGIASAGSDTEAKGVLDYQKSLQELARTQKDVAYSVAMANVQYDEQTGKMSRADAAVAKQNINQMHYEQQRADLQEKLNALQDGPEKNAQATGLKQQIAQLDGNRVQEQMRDAATVAGTEWSSALKQANDEWLNDSADTAKQVVDLYRSSISTINGGIVNSMFGRGNWSQTWMQEGMNLAGTGLQRAEGGLMKAFGLGKADGSRSNPFYVSMVSDTSGVGGVASSILSQIPILGTVFGGGRSIGGGVDAGSTYLVGEKGPELLTMGGAGHVTPNSKLGSMGGDTFHAYTIKVDGGVTPEQFHQTMKQLVPGIVQQSSAHAVAAVRDQAKRRPFSAAR